MKRAVIVICSACSILVLLLPAGALPGTLVPIQSIHVAPGTDRDVIVILRDRMPDLPATRGMRAARASALARAQSPILFELQQSGATHIRPFGMINAVAATLSQTEVDRLAGHPLVQAVVPDVPARLPRHKRNVRTVPAADHASIATSVDPSVASELCNTLEPQALQLTNTAFLDPSIPQAQQVLDGNGISPGAKWAS